MTNGRRSTDSVGNYQSTSGVVSGLSSVLQVAESSFHQDLNGDGIISVPGGGNAIATAQGLLTGAPATEETPLIGLASLQHLDHA